MRPKDIICIWAFGWFGLWQRHQQVMSRLAENHRILYIETPRDIWSFIRGIFKKQISISQIFTPRRVLENLFVFSPLVPFSLKKYPKLNQRYLSFILPLIRRMLKSLEMEDPILWICYPSGAYFIGKLGKGMTFYDCCDDLTDVAPSLAKKIAEQEELLMKNADAVFVTTEGLFESKEKFNSNTHLIPNAADYEHFSRAAFENLPVPEDMKNIKGPKIGFCGSLQHWIDTDLLHDVARRRPDWAFVIVGGVHVDVSRLKRLPNVYLLGQKRYDDLPSYLKHFDVCMLPFKLNKIALASDPIKVYEYLAAGKPVVSTDIPRARSFGEVKVARHKEEFITLIEEALKEKGQGKIDQRMKIGMENAWDHRLKTIEDIFSKMISGD